MDPATDPTPKPAAPPAAWVRLWHPRGVDVRLPIVVGEPVTVSTWREVLASVDAAIDAGFLATAPGLEPGETREMIGAVVCRVKEGNRDGSSTSVVDLYAAGDPATNRYRLLSVYLNTEADEHAFERASGLRLDQLPTYIGVGHIERCKSAQLDTLVVTAPKPFAVAWKLNPKHDPTEKDQTKMKPKRLFSRWPDLPTAAANPLEVGREAIRTAPTVAALADVWKSLPGDLKTQLAAEKDARKAALAAPAAR